MKKIVFTASLVLMAILAFAQPKIKFDQTTYQFGDIKEEGGKVTGKFEFTNVGDSALVLVSVRPGCGCTAANYTKTPIEPGQRGFIDATYDPRNRPGAFTKSIRVTTNEPEDASKSPHVIYIKGNVLKRPPTEFEIAGYKTGNGMVRIKENTKKLELKNTESHLDTFMLRNFWNRNVAVDYKNMPAHITEHYRSFGKELKPNEEGIIVLKYNAAAKNEFGNVNDHIILQTNDTLESNKVIAYTVKIKEDFSGLNERMLKNAPAIKADTLVVDFGQVARNQQVQKELKINNAGKSPLIIRTIQPSSNAITVTPKTQTVAPGSSIVLDMQFKAQGRNGKQNGTIDVISNDPTKDNLVIKYTAEILK